MSKGWKYNESLKIPERGSTGWYRVAGKHKITGEIIVEMEFVGDSEEVVGRFYLPPDKDSKKGEKKA